MKFSKQSKDKKLLNFSKPVLPLPNIQNSVILQNFMTINNEFNGLKTNKLGYNLFRESMPQLRIHNQYSKRINRTNNRKLQEKMIIFKSKDEQKQTKYQAKHQNNFEEKKICKLKVKNNKHKIIYNKQNVKKINQYQKNIYEETISSNSQQFQQQILELINVVQNYQKKQIGSQFSQNNLKKYINLFFQFINHSDHYPKINKFQIIQIIKSKLFSTFFKNVTYQISNQIQLSYFQKQIAKIQNIQEEFNKQAYEKKEIAQYFENHQVTQQNQPCSQQKKLLFPSDEKILQRKKLNITDRRNGQFFSKKQIQQLSHLKLLNESIAKETFLRLHISNRDKFEMKKEKIKLLQQYICHHPQITFDLVQKSKRYSKYLQNLEKKLNRNIILDQVSLKNSYNIDKLLINQILNELQKSKQKNEQIAQTIINYSDKIDQTYSIQSIQQLQKISQSEVKFPQLKNNQKINQLTNMQLSLTKEISKQQNDTLQQKQLANHGKLQILFMKSQQNFNQSRTKKIMKN